MEGEGRNKGSEGGGIYSCGSRERGRGEEGRKERGLRRGHRRKVRW